MTIGSREEILVSAFLDNRSCVENDDLVGMGNGREAVTEWLLAMPSNDVTERNTYAMISRVRP